MTETNFKHTEVGLIPHDWNIFSVGNDCYIKARIGWQGLTTAEYMDHGDYGLITSTDIVDGKINWKTCWFVSEDRYRQDTKIQVRENDVLISKDGTIGKVGIVKKLPYPATLNSGVFVIRSSNSQQSQKGLSLAFISPFFDDFIKRLTAGSTIVHLYQKDIVNYTYPLPPTTAEQERIVDALSSIDTLIGALTEQIEKKRHIKQGAMQKLLSLPSIEPVLLDDIVKAGDIKLYRGKVISKKDIEQCPGDYPIYSSSVQNEGLMGCYGKYMFEEEMISWSVDGGGNFFYRPKHRFSITNVSGYMRINTNKYDYKFLAYLLQFEHAKKIFDYQTKAHPSVIRKAYELRIPASIEEQKSIASVLSNMDTEIAALEQKRDKYIAIKSGMMQNLLTGKIRLV